MSSDDFEMLASSSSSRNFCDARGLPEAISDAFNGHTQLPSAAFNGTQDNPDSASVVVTYDYILFFCPQACIASKNLQFSPFFFHIYSFLLDRIHAVKLSRNQSK